MDECTKEISRAKASVKESRERLVELNQFMTANHQHLQVSLVVLSVLVASNQEVQDEALKRVSFESLMALATSPLNRGVHWITLHYMACLCKRPSPLSRRHVTNSNLLQHLLELVRQYANIVDDASSIFTTSVDLPSISSITDNASLSSEESSVARRVSESKGSVHKLCYRCRCHIIEVLYTVIRDDSHACELLSKDRAFLALLSMAGAFDCNWSHNTYNYDNPSLPTDAATKACDPCEYCKNSQPYIYGEDTYTGTLYTMLAATEYKSGYATCLDVIAEALRRVTSLLGNLFSCNCLTI